MRKNIPKKIIVHHSNGVVASPCASTKHHTVYDVDRWHKTRWLGFTSKQFKNPRTGRYWHCGYTFCIWKNEAGRWNITQTRGLDEEGAHTIGQNTSSIGVLIIGNYDKCSPDTLEKGATDRFKALYEQELSFIPPSKIYPHRKYAAKSCPGDSLPDDYFQKLVARKENIDIEKQKRKLLEKIRDLMQMLIARLLSRATGKLSIRQTSHLV